jgi:hypothetical protein
MNKTYKYINQADLTQYGFNPGLADSIERMMKSLNFEEPDRVPVFDIVQNEGFINYYSGERISVDNGESVLLKALSNSIDASTEINPPALKASFNRDGFIYKRDTWSEWLVERPFKNMPEFKEYVRKNIDEIKNTSPKDSWSCAGKVSYTGSDEDPVCGFIRQQKQAGRCSLLINEGDVGFDTALLRAGFENFIFLYYEDPDLISEWLEVLAVHEIKRINYLANSKISPVTMEIAELADKNGLTFPPEFFKKEVFPRLKRINNEWHKQGTKVIFHSCGNILPVLDEIIDCGCDGINPVAKVEGMDIIKEIKTNYPKICIVGGIDANYLLEKGSKEEVEKEVRRVIDIAAPGGGFILGSSIEMLPNHNPENLIAMVETCKSYGIYKN